MTRRRLAILLAPCLVCGLALRAQHTEAPHPAPAHTEPAPSKVEAPEVPAPTGGAATAAAPEPAAAAGHEAAGAHHGAPVLLFGRELGPMAQWLVKLFNFAIFAGVLVYALKGVLSAAFRTRAKELEEQLSIAERERAQAEAQLKELEGRMAGMQAELDTILSKAEAEAEAERERIVEAARLEAAAILAQTRFDIESQQRHAEQELRALVAELAVAGARKQLETRLAGGEAAQVLDRAIAQVGGV